MDGEAPPGASPPTTQSPLQTLSTSPTAGATSSLRLPRLPATDAKRNFSPRRIAIMLFIFLLAFFVPNLRTLNQPADESNNPWQEVNEIYREEIVDMGSRDGRLQWEAMALANLERNKGAPSQQEGWPRTEEVSNMGGGGIFEGVGFNRGFEVTGFDKIEMEESYFLSFSNALRLFAG